MSNGHNVLKIMHIGAKVGQRLVMSLSDRFTFWTGGVQNVGSFQKTAWPCSLGYAAASCAFSPLSNPFLCLGQFLKAQQQHRRACVLSK